MSCVSVFILVGIFFLCGIGMSCPDLLIQFQGLKKKGVHTVVLTIQHVLEEVLYGDFLLDVRVGCLELYQCGKIIDKRYLQ